MPNELNNPLCGSTSAESRSTHHADPGASDAQHSSLEVSDVRPIPSRGKSRSAPRTCWDCDLLGLGLGPSS
eukprot:4585730-Alexandrium_andersonii.AAC.1